MFNTERRWLKFSVLLVLAGALILGCGRKDSPTGPEEAVEELGNGPYPIRLLRLSGTPYEIGYQHGRAVRDQIQAFYGRLREIAQTMNLPIEFLDNAYISMEPYIPERYKEEMQGLADGADVSLEDVHRLHALPDLSEYHCTFFAAWGEATADHQLLQIRALDYATNAHFQEYPAVLIVKPDEGVPHAVIGYLGFIGAVSGMNAEGIAVSEIGENYGAEHETLSGEPMPFLLRDVLWDARSLEQAVQTISNAKRTSSYLYAVGDAKIPSARAFRTAKDFCYVYTDVTLPRKTLKNVVYFSMDWDSPYNDAAHAFLKPRLGLLDVEMAKEFMRVIHTGSLHAVVYHPSTSDFWVANAGPNGEPAYDRDYVHVNLKEELDLISR